MRRVHKGTTINRISPTISPARVMYANTSDCTLQDINRNGIILDTSLSDVSAGSPRGRKRQFRSVMKSNRTIDSSTGSADLNFSFPKMNHSRLDMTDIRKQKIPWGIQGYRAPLTVNSSNMSANGGKFGKSKLTSFIDDIKKKKSKLPPAFKYNHISDWSKIIRSNQGKFKLSKKTTFTEEIGLRNAKLPSPTQYNVAAMKANISTLKSRKGNLGVIGKEAKRCGFVDEASHDGLKSPSHIYNTDVTFIKPKLYGARIYKGKNPRVESLTGHVSPAPGVYNTSDSFRKTQINSSNIKFGKTNRSGFFEEAQKASKKVPGVGAYKNFDAAFDKLSRSPRANRSPRK